MQLFKLQFVEIKINCRCRGSSLSEKESLCKTVKWHRVPVLSHRWWISVHHAEQAVIIQLTSKSLHSRIAQEKLGRGVWFASENPHPIYDQNVRCSLPYL